MNEHELKAMQEQVTSDFRMTWKMIGDVADSIEQQGRETAERLRQVEGRMRLTEERFTAMMEAVTDL